MNHDCSRQRPRTVMGQILVTRRYALDDNVARPPLVVAMPGVARGRSRSVLNR